MRTANNAKRAAAQDANREERPDWGHHMSNYCNLFKEEQQRLLKEVKIPLGKKSLLYNTMMAIMLIMVLFWLCQ